MLPFVETRYTSTRVRRNKSLIVKSIHGSKKTPLVFRFFTNKYFKVALTQTKSQATKNWS